MKKIWKRTIAVVAVLAILVGCALGFVGNYFYTLAIDADSDKSIVFGEEDVNTAEEAAKEKEVNEFLAQTAQETWMTNKDGYQLRALESSNSDSHQWIIVVHGYLSEAENMVSYANEFIQNGYRVLLPDLRGHGKSDGDAIGMGAWDSDDVIEWIHYILEKDPQAEIALFGVSMGASTVLMASGKDIPKEVVAVVEDCGYTSAWDQFAYQLDDLFSLPSFPVINVANIVNQIRAGYDLRDADALQAAKQSDTPTLFIHGDADDFVPTDMVYDLYDAAACEKQLLIIEGAGHAKSRLVNPELYWTTVLDFVDQQFAE